jgi:probable F420-dependent oxidoreductase
MKTFAAMPPELPLAAVPGYARRVERLGFDGLHIAETIHDSMAVALLVVEHTTDIVVRTAVTLAFVRSPTLVAYTAWDLAILSGGRFELGLGTQIKQNIQDRFGMPWTEPRTRMAEYIAVLQALFEAFRTGSGVHYEGDSYRVTRLQPYFNPGPKDIEPPRIWLGAVSAGMCELAGSTAHGVVTHSTNSDPAYLRDVVCPALRRGAQARGRDERPLVVASTAIATGDTDESVANERERQRRMLAFLLSTPAYAPALERRGWTELAERLRTLTRGQRWNELPTVLGDPVLDELVICGRYGELPQILRTKFEGIADGVVLPPLGDDSDDQPIRECVRGLQQERI